MNEKLVEKALLYLQNTEDFLVEQVPDYMSQVLEYHFYSGVIYLSIGTILLLSVIPSMIIVYKEDKKQSAKCNDFLLIGGTLYTLFGLSTGIMCFALNFSNTLKIFLAPKMFLVEYFQNML